MMNTFVGNVEKQILSFNLDKQLYALFLSKVERVVHAVEITILPKAPEFVLGIINVQGQVIPVVDIRKRLHLEPHTLLLDDKFILTANSIQRLAIVIDSVDAIRELHEWQLVSAEEVMLGLEYIHGLVKLENNMALIFDLDQFFSVEDKQKLVLAIKEDRQMNQKDMQQVSK